MTKTAYIALGSNLGDRREHLDRALQVLQEHPALTVSAVASYHETEPVGGPPGQGKYLNSAAELQTDLDPGELLQVLLNVEQALGRERGVPNAPRTIDLDLLLVGDQVCQHSGLILPHPRMHERPFVLLPLTEIAPDVVHPLLGKPIKRLLYDLRAAGNSDRLDDERRREREVAEHMSEMEAQIFEGIASTKEEPFSLTLPTFPAPAGSLGRELVGLRALVTGSTSGIGRGIAIELAKAGADVIIHGRRREAAEALAEQLRQTDVRIHTIIGNLRDASDCTQIVDAAWQVWDGLDIWINNAGADTLTGPAAAWSFERKLAELLAVDVTATMLLSRAVGQRMKERGQGIIVNMSWDQAETGMEGDSGQLFAAVKAAVSAFSKSLAVSLAPQVRVNCLAPGWIRTAWGERASTAWQDRARREALLGRWGTPEDVAAAARWLVGPGAAFITGQIIRVNGGAVR